MALDKRAAEDVGVGDLRGLIRLRELLLLKKHAVQGLLRLSCGFLRFVLPIVPDASHEFAPVVITLSLIGVIFEIYFLSLQLFVIHALCVWCTSYGVSLIARFLVAMVIWIRRGRLAARLH